jgi:hypothetical protein
VHGEGKKIDRKLRGSNTHAEGGSAWGAGRAASMARPRRRRSGTASSSMARAPYADPWRGNGAAGVRGGGRGIELLKPIDTGLVFFAWTRTWTGKQRRKRLDLQG